MAADCEGRRPWVPKKAESGFSVLCDDRVLAGVFAEVNPPSIGRHLDGRGAACCAPAQTSQLQRDISGFLAGIRVALVFEGTQSGDDAGAGVGGVGFALALAPPGRDGPVWRNAAAFRHFLLAAPFP